MVVSGGVEATIRHSYVVIGGSAEPSATSTRTSNLCTPRDRPSYSFGERHGENVPPLVGVVSAHSYSRSRPGEEKTNSALVESVLIGGPDSIMTAGAPSMFQL